MKALVMMMMMIHQDLHMYHPRKDIRTAKKNFGGTPKQGSLKNQHFTTGLKEEFYEISPFQARTTLKLDRATYSAIAS